MPDHYVVAVDIGGTTIKTELQDDAGRPFWSERTPTPKADPGAAIEAVLAAAERAVQVGLEQRAATPAAIGIASLGLVDSTAGVARLSAAVGWLDVPLRQLVTERTGLPTVLGHDIRAAALAEASRTEARPLLFVAVGTGVGGALVTETGAYLGRHELAVEIGHISIHGTDDCACGGVGCLETVASAAAIERHYLEQTGRAASTREIAIDPSPAAVRVWRSAAQALAGGLAVAVTLFDPAVIVLGGGVAEAGRDYLELVETFLLEACRLTAPPPLWPAQFGERAALVGAGLLARSRVEAPRLTAVRT